MLHNMASSLIKNERIETTLQKAKELRSVVEKMVTKAKKDNLHQRRLLASVISERPVLKKVFSDLAPRFKNRPGGYTRILRKSTRRSGDAAEMAIIEFVDYVLPEAKIKKKKAKKEEKLDSKELERQALAAGGSSPKDSVGKSTSKVVSKQKKNPSTRKV